MARKKAEETVTKVTKKEATTVTEKPTKVRKPRSKKSETAQVETSQEVEISGSVEITTEEKPKTRKPRAKKSETAPVESKETTIEEKPKTRKPRAKKSEVQEVPVEPETKGADVSDDIDIVLETTSLYDEEKTKLDLEGLAALSKETKKSMAFVSDKQIRLIIDNYYQTQHHRMNIANQIRAVAQDFDQVQEGEQPAIAWLLKDVQNRENQIKHMIAEYVKTVPPCQWAMAVKGIGPIFAANLWSYIDMSKCHHATQFISYAGLNDQNAPWLGKEKATKIVNEAYEHFGLATSDPITDDVLLRIAVNSGRNLPGVKRGFLSHKEKATSKTTDKTIAINYLSKPPYNLELKKMCYLIGESFCKVSNRGSLYGELYKERKAIETMKNENGEYREQAERLLSEKNYSHDTDTYKYLSEGKLSPAHINQRAKRWAVSKFMVHFFEVCYAYTHKTKPPVIYPIAHQGHVDYIEPEVPYSRFVEYEK